MAKKTSLEQQLDQLEKLRTRGTLTDDEYRGRRQAILSSAPIDANVRAKSGSGGIFKAGFFGCLGIIAAVIALVVVIAVVITAAAGGDDDDGAPAAPGLVGTNKGDVHVPFAANSAGEIAPEGNGDRKVKVTILQTANPVEPSNQFEKPNAGMKFFGVEVAIENVGSKEATSLSWKLRDSKDGEHDQDFVVGGPGKALDGVFNLTPGGKVQGWIYFEIPSDTDPKWLRADPNVFLANDLYFDAQ